MDEPQHCYRHPGRETYVSCSECGRPICEDCMTFAPVGIRCPEHASVGAPKPAPQRTLRRAKASATGLAAPVTTVLVALNVLVYLITVAQGSGINDPGGEAFAQGALAGSLVADGEWWRLVTSMFLHASLIHLAFNMLALWWLGSVVEQAMGPFRFLLVYIASGLAGSAGALLLTDPNVYTVGASGAIYGIMGALLVLEWHATRSIAGPALTLILLNLFISVTIPGVSLGGHLGGLVGGVLATFALVSTRHLRRPLLGPALVVLVAVASVVLALVRVQTYV